MRKHMMAGNWKMNKSYGESLTFIKELSPKVRSYGNVDIIICPVSTALKSMCDLVAETNISIGAQNMHWEESGAYTGEISPSMLTDIGCIYVIIGHSERRQYFAETDETVNKKIKSALGKGLNPIVCCGESLDQRESEKTFDIIGEQIKGALAGITTSDMKTVVIAYEPIWAIGTGKTASPAQANDVHKFIRQTLSELYDSEIAASTRILYGGSVKPDNIKDLISEPDIDGGLVGGASLKDESFAKLVEGVNG